MAADEERRVPSPETIQRLSRPGQIQILQPRLPLRGKIKIGGRGAKHTSPGGATWFEPLKYDHFEIRLINRTGPDGDYARDEQAHALVGDKPVSIPVRLMFHDVDLNLSSKLAFYRSVKVRNSKNEWITVRRPWCHGNGKVAIRYGTDADGKWEGEEFERRCPCDFYESGHCKPQGVLTVLLEGGKAAASYEFRTSAKGSIRSLLGSLLYYKQMAFGKLAGIKFNLMLRYEPATTPDGMATTIPVVFLEYDGTAAELQAEARPQLTDRAFEATVAQAEADARELKSARVFGADDQEDEEIFQEYYGDTAKEEAGAGAAVHPAAGQTDQPTPPAANPAATPPPPAGTPITQPEPAQQVQTDNAPVKKRPPVADLI